MVRSNNVNKRFLPELAEIPRTKEGNKKLYFLLLRLRQDWDSKQKDPKAGLNISFETLMNYYKLYLEELDRRGLKRLKPHELDRRVEAIGKADGQKAMYLIPRACKLIYSGEKTLLVKAKKFEGQLEKDFILTDDKYAYGVIRLTRIKEMSREQVDATRTESKITDEDMEDWKGVKTFYGYRFRFKKFKRIRPVKVPHGAQTFYELRKRKALTFRFLGTCALEHFPREDPPACDQCKEEAKEPKHQRHASLLINKRYMLDAGMDWIGKVNDVGPKYVLITHAHPDHVGAIVHGRRKIKAEVHGPKGLRQDIVELYGVVGVDLVEHEPYEPFTLDGIEFEYVAVNHSTRAPTFAIKVDQRLLYNPDFHSFKKSPRVELEGIELYIGDGSALEKDISRRNKVGHMSMYNQVEMCFKQNVEHVKFTHVGHIYRDYEDSKATLRTYSRNKGFYKDPNQVYIAKDGDQFTLETSAEVRKAVGTFMKPNKPGWRIFEKEEIFDVPGFELPAQTTLKIDGMRIQIHVGEDVHLYSEDEGFEKGKMFKRACKEIEDKVPKGTVLDAEGVMVRDGQVLHRTSFIGYANSGEYDEEKDSNSQFWVFDVMYWKGNDVRDEALSERMKYLAKLPVTDHIKPFKQGKQLFVAESRDELLKHIDRVSDKKGSEGALIKTLESRIVKDVHNKGWVKLKNLKEIDCIVVDIEQPKHTKGPEEGKPVKGVYNYHTAAGPYSKECGKVVKEKEPKKAVELEGKVYAYLGKTFNTSVKAPKGAIIRIYTPEVNRYPIEGTNCSTYGVFEPKVLEHVKERRIPDSMNVLNRLSAQTLPRKDIGEVTTTDPGWRSPGYGKPEKPERLDWRIMEEILSKQDCIDVGGKWVTVGGKQVCIYPVTELQGPDVAKARTPSERCASWGGHWITLEDGRHICIGDDVKGQFTVPTGGRRRISIKGIKQKIGKNTTFYAEKGVRKKRLDTFTAIVQHEPEMCKREIESVVLVDGYATINDEEVLGFYYEPYFGKNTTIVISEYVMSSDLLHELGHHLYRKTQHLESWRPWNRRYARAIREERKWISNYAKVNDSEDFAEHYALFRANPTACKKDYPKRFKVFESLTKHVTRSAR